MALQPYHANIAEVPREYVLDGRLSRAAFVSEGALFTFTWVREMSSVAPAKPNRHPFDQWMYFVEGTMELILWDDDVYRVRAGDVLHIPRDVPHRPRFLSDEPVLILEAYSPLRVEFLHLAEHQTTAAAAARRPDGSRVQEGPPSEWAEHPAYR